jgi:prepilin-type N-terminal cleavage/methylation domain-containing protein
MSDRGFTLLEILLVAAVLGIMVLAVIPSVQPYKEQRLDVAAREVAAAVRFARDETISTGKQHGVIVNVGSQRLQVFWFSPASPLTRIFNVRDPLDKKLYDLQFATDPVLSGVQVTGASFYYQGRINPTDFVDFDKWGTPKFNDAGTIRLLNNGEIKLASGTAERFIRVDPMTGRVSVL